MRDLSHRTDAATLPALAALTAVTAAHLRTLARLAALRAELRDAYTDPVTGLPVRRVAQLHLDTASGAGLTLARVDVNGLHELNKAAALREAAPAPDDLVARLGGDEFLILTATRPQRLAAALTARLAAPARIGATLVALSASVGICPISGDARAALACADAAMYAAKHRGGGIEHYDTARHGSTPPPGARPALRRRDRHRTTSR